MVLHAWSNLIDNYRPTTIFNFFSMDDVTFLYNGPRKHAAASDVIESSCSG